MALPYWGEIQTEPNRFTREELERQIVALVAENKMLREAALYWHAQATKGGAVLPVEYVQTLQKTFKENAQHFEKVGIDSTSEVRAATYAGVSTAYSDAAASVETLMRVFGPESEAR